MEATLHNGSPIMADYTPSGAVAAGEVVVLSNNLVIAHNDIAAGALGAVAVSDGVYKVGKSTGSGTNWADGVLLYWDNSANVATTTAGSNKKLGKAVGAAGASDTFGYFLHIAQAV